MLQNLHVKNLALIDETEVEFGPGLNILSGETGAGKSIIIGSINLALGEKVQKEMLRDNGESALVELIFFVEDADFEKRFKFHSAAKTVHHGFVGGLLEHSLSVAKHCDYLSLIHI